MMNPTPSINGQSPPPQSRRRVQHGATLIEVLVTFLILSIGLLGLAGMQTNALKEGLDTSQRSQAIWILQEMVERMRANSAALPAGYDIAVDPDADNCGVVPVKICADYINGTNRADAALDCSSAEMAAFDIWEVYCGHSHAGITSSSTESIDLAGMTISCDDAICTGTSNYTLSLSWTAKNLKAQLESGQLLDNATNDRDIQTLSIVVRP